MSVYLPKEVQEGLEQARKLKWSCFSEQVCG